MSYNIRLRDPQTGTIASVPRHFSHLYWEHLELRQGIRRRFYNKRAEDVLSELEETLKQLRIKKDSD